MVEDEMEPGLNILCLHTRFNMEEMDKVMGRDAAYVTMLRDPVSVFESLWHFYGLQGHFGMDIGKHSVVKIYFFSRDFTHINLFNIPELYNTSANMGSHSIQKGLKVEDYFMVGTILVNNSILLHP